MAFSDLTLRDGLRLKQAWDKARPTLDLSATIQDLISEAEPGLRTAAAAIADGRDAWSALEATLAPASQKALARVRQFISEAHGDEYANELLERLSR